MHVAYIGNFGPEHSTENEVRRALINNGHEVWRVQEGDQDDLALTIAMLKNPQLQTAPFDFVLWTRTGGLAAKVDQGLYWHLLAQGRRSEVAIVGYHLDRWWGLARQIEIEADPFFQVDLLCTADGGHDAEWEAAGVNHVWFPPAISERNCYLGTPREEYASDIAFVGSWEGGYHPEDTHRPALIQWLRDNYSQRVKFWPRHGEHAIRGSDLNDLYASVKVVVGTSCLAPKVDGSPMTHYCSDRIPETLGRGGILLHPSVEGIDKPYGQQFVWDMNVWADLGDGIEALLMAHNLDKNVTWAPESAGSMESHRLRAIEYTKQYHTYESRMSDLMDNLEDRGML